MSITPPATQVLQRAKALAIRASLDPLWSNLDALHDELVAQTAHPATDPTGTVEGATAVDLILSETGLLFDSDPENPLVIAWFTDADGRAQKRNPESTKYRMCIRLPLWPWPICF